MHKISAAMAVCVLGAGLVAQTAPKSFTSPTGYLTKSTGNVAGFPYAMFLFGSRTQHADQDMPATTRALSKLELRTQTQASYTSVSGMGRTFSMGALSLGYTDCAKMTSVFSTNFMGSMPTQVFSGTVKLATHTGMPTQKWGNAGSFSFAKPWIWKPTKAAPHLLQEWNFGTGTLANGSTTTTFSNYRTDGGAKANSSTFFSPTSAAGAPGSKYVPKNPSTGTACADSAITSTTADAFSYLSAILYDNDWVGAPYKPGTIRRSLSYSQYTAPGASVIHALTVGGSDTGANVGMKCNNLHVNMGFPLLIIAAKASNDALARTPTTLVPGTAVPFSNSWKGLALYWQGIWNDSKTMQPSLTIASKLVLPGLVNGSAGCTVYAYKLSSGSWAGTSSATNGFAPVYNAFNNYTEKWDYK